MYKSKSSITRFPDRDLIFPEHGNFSSGPEKSGNLSLQSLRQLKDLLLSGPLYLNMLPTLITLQRINLKTS